MGALGCGRKSVIKLELTRQAVQSGEAAVLHGIVSEYPFKMFYSVVLEGCRQQ